MKRTNQILLGLGCLALLVISWVVVLGAKSDSDKQVDLLAKSTAYINDKVYILSVPLLEEAAGYNAKHTLEAETELKKVYLQLIEQNGYKKKYISLLEKQMNRKDVSAEVFREVANFYWKDGKINEALTVLKDGMKKTGSEELATLYEDNRYEYHLGRMVYEDVTDIYGKTIGVKQNGLWGLAVSDGALHIPCDYDQVSTYSSGRMIVQKDGEIYAVDSSNNRLALLKEKVLDFGNYGDNRLTLLMDDGWKCAGGDFQMGNAVFDDIGTYLDGYAAAKENGKWGIIDTSFKWIIPAEYDEIIMDGLGRSYMQKAIFIKKGNSVNLLVDGNEVGQTYEDARPFGTEGYAAVMKGGKWGFIDVSGEVKIDFQFENALSFGQHLAAVKQGDLWGYISIDGSIVIKPIFFQAKSFVDGNAPVLTEAGWQFITLLEYKKGASL